MREGRNKAKRKHLLPRLRVMWGNNIALGPGKVELLKHIQSSGYFENPLAVYFDNGSCMFCPSSGTERAQPRKEEPLHARPLLRFLYLIPSVPFSS